MIASTSRAIMSSMLLSSVAASCRESAVTSRAKLFLAAISTDRWRQVWNRLSPPLTNPRVSGPSSAEPESAE
ncbi:hypothetical protein [Streptomyces sp. IBSBF 2507]|uniref:hypothetical protein n=1 Tax=Streptomyces sp. IBSBF 2507 TaxID=2903530 RepID=UPI00351EDE81